MWGWGDCEYKRIGFPEDIYDGVFQPRQVKFVEKEKLKPLRIECGFDHSMLLVEDQYGG